MGLEAAKAVAARKAVQFISKGHVVGIGSGSTVVHAVKALAERNHKEGLGVTCIPSSFQVLIEKYV